MIKIEERPLTNEMIIHSNFKAMSCFDKAKLYRLLKIEGRDSVVQYIQKVILDHIANVIEHEIRENDVQIILCLGCDPND